MNKLFVCILFLMLLLPVFSFSTAIDGNNTIYVDAGGGADYTRIQDAIDNASDGDTVFVYRGEYYENIQINISISLAGEDKQDTIINGGGNGNVISIHADFVNISGFTVKNSAIRNAGIYVYDSYSTCIFDCIITRNNGSGVELDLTKHALVSSCVISLNNQFGIVIYPSDGNSHRSSDNVVSDCIISDNAEGVFINAAMNSTIVGNEIFRNRVYGVHIAYGVNNVITENNFIVNRRCAYFQGIHHNVWSNNFWYSQLRDSHIKIIFGRVFLFPLLNFDWNPASDPYELDGEI